MFFKNDNSYYGSKIIKIQEGLCIFSGRGIFTKMDHRSIGRRPIISRIQRMGRFRETHSLCAIEAYAEKDTNIRSPPLS
jgi:hypothetical protein